MCSRSGGNRRGMWNGHSARRGTLPGGALEGGGNRFAEAGGPQRLQAAEREAHRGFLWCEVAEEWQRQNSAALVGRSGVPRGSSQGVQRHLQDPVQIDLWKW